MMRPCHLLDSSQLFKGWLCLHVQGQTVQEGMIIFTLRSQLETGVIDVCNKFSNAFLLPPSF
jgi:hypothetical protein